MHNAVQYMASATEAPSVWELVADAGHRSSKLEAPCCILRMTFVMKEGDKGFRIGVDNPDERDTEADAEGTIRFGIEKANWAHCSGTMMVVGIAKGENNGVGMV